MVSNWFIVVPKIRRVLSGERVVMSQILRNTNSTMPAYGIPTPKAGVEANPVNPLTTGIAEKTEESPITHTHEDENQRQTHVSLKQDEPIPGSVESELHSVQQMITSFTSDW